MLYWAPVFAYGTLVIHTNNNTALHGILNGATGSPLAMDALRSLLLTAARYNIPLHAVCVSAEENALADALSRFDWGLVANLYP